MEDLHIIKEFFILLAVSIPIIFIFNKLKLPTLVGFLATGIFLGPSGIKLIADVSGVEILAEIGIALLLFTIGLQFSFVELAQMRKSFIAGILQIVATVLATTAISFFITHNVALSIFIGFLVSLSSTAIVMKHLIDKGEVDSVHGYTSMGILLLQDLSIVPMMIIIPYLKGGESFEFILFLKAFFFAISSLFVIFIVASLILPKLIDPIVKSRNRELFTISIVVVCLGTAYLTAYLGFSLAIGAFLAGFILSRLDYRYQIIADILPFRDIFNSIFFISIGMLVDINIFRDIVFVVGGVFGIITIKFLILVPIMLLLKYPLRITVIVGLSLAQIGEFSFVLGKFGNKFNLISDEYYHNFIVLSSISMLLTPFLMIIAPKLGLTVQKYFKIPFKKDKVEYKTLKELKNHVVIIGYGLNGKNLARVLKEVGINYVIIDINSRLVKEAKDVGEPILFGDFTKREILKQVCIENAKIAVIAISDSVAVRQGLFMIKNLNSSIYIIIRTRYTSEVNELQKLGADQVIPEEFETSIEIFSRVLRQYHIPRNVVLTQGEIIRKDGYKMLRKLSLEPFSVLDLKDILSITLTDIVIIKEGSNAVDKTIFELGLREKTGATIIAVVRNGKAFTNPKSDFKIEPNDMLVVFGSHADIDSVISYIS
ncbi:MAG: cation:proton antiporter [Candidatus Firestonebacteria bacterium]